MNVRSSRGFAERIQIHRDEIDRRDVVGRERLHVLGHVAASEEAAVDRGMQRLHSSVEHLREAGDVGDVLRGNPCLSKRACGASRRDDLPATRSEGASQLGHACLVGNGYESARHDEGKE